MPFKGSTSGTLHAARGLRASLTVSSRHRTTKLSERLRRSLSPLLRSQSRCVTRIPPLGVRDFPLGGLTWIILLFLFWRCLFSSCSIDVSPCPVRSYGGRGGPGPPKSFGSIELRQLTYICCKCIYSKGLGKVSIDM